jgi:hypothetical protein
VLDGTTSEAQRSKPIPAYSGSKKRVAPSITVGG